MFFQSSYLLSYQFGKLSIGVIFLGDQQKLL